MIASLARTASPAGRGRDRRRRPQDWPPHRSHAVFVGVADSSSRPRRGGGRSVGRASAGGLAEFAIGGQPLSFRANNMALWISASVTESRDFLHNNFTYRYLATVGPAEKPLGSAGAVSGMHNGQHQGTALCAGERGDRDFTSRNEFARQTHRRMRTTPSFCRPLVGGIGVGSARGKERFRWVR